METVLSDHPSLPRQARLLCSTGASMFMNARLSSTPKACPSFMVGCFLNQMQSWCSVTNLTRLYWGSYPVCGVISSADSKPELPAPTCMMHGFDFVGNAQLLFFGVSRQDVRRFGNASPPERKLLEGIGADYQYI